MTELDPLQPYPQNSLFSFGDNLVDIDTAHNRLQLDGKEYEIAQREFDLLAFHAYKRDYVLTPTYVAAKIFRVGGSLSSLRTLYASAREILSDGLGDTHAALLVTKKGLGTIAVSASDGRLEMRDTYYELGDGRYEVSPNQQIAKKDGTWIKNLRPKELKILSILGPSADTPVHLNDLSDILWGHHDAHTNWTVRMHIRNLKLALGEDPADQKGVIRLARPNHYVAVTSMDIDPRIYLSTE
jgi:hypothetical protein